MSAQANSVKMQGVDSRLEFALELERLPSWELLLSLDGAAQNSLKELGWVLSFGY